AFDVSVGRAGLEQATAEALGETFGLVLAAAPRGRGEPEQRRAVAPGVTEHVLAVRQAERADHMGVARRDDVVGLVEDHGGATLADGREPPLAGQLADTAGEGLDARDDQGRGDGDFGGRATAPRANDPEGARLGVARAGRLVAAEEPD